MSETTNTTISQNNEVPRAGVMSAEDFELLMDRLNALSIRRVYSDKSRHAARLVMVDGASETKAAAEVGLNSRAVNQLMKRIRRRMELLPAGWVQVKGWFPVEVAKQLDALSELLQEAQKSGTPLNMTSFEIILPKD